MDDHIIDRIRQFWKKYSYLMGYDANPEPQAAQHDAEVRFRIRADSCSAQEGLKILTKLDQHFQS